MPVSLVTLESGFLLLLLGLSVVLGLLEFLIGLFRPLALVHLTFTARATQVWGKTLNERAYVPGVVQRLGPLRFGWTRPGQVVYFYRPTLFRKAHFLYGLVKARPGSVVLHIRVPYSLATFALFAVATFTLVWLGVLVNQGVGPAAVFSFITAGFALYTRWLYRSEVEGIETLLDHILEFQNLLAPLVPRNVR